MGRTSRWIPLVTAWIVGITTIFTMTLAAPAGATDTFTDDDGSVHEPDIEFVAALGITVGCGPQLYCPSRPVTRGEMAAYLNRALSLPDTTADYFTDDAGSLFENDINRLAASGITVGCDIGLYCPDGSVRRDEMAAFLNRAFGLPATTADFFTDDAGSFFEDDINRLAASGITLGCDDGLYCPDGSVRRDQMASFLTRALTLGSAVTQTSFGIYDDGPQFSASLVEDVGMEDRGAVVAPDTTLGIRVALTNTGTVTMDVRPKLQFRFIGASALFSS
ncbi:MAG: S-layer homology domain-containing protein, partial [Acidimicrobiia bacterium]|nr:S-layer homology domain-containing protein [Acidimicrobiia bacterium]